MVEQKKEKLYSTSSSYSLATESIFFSKYKYYIDNKCIYNAQIPRHHSSNFVYVVKIHPVFYYNKNPTKGKILTTDFLMFL